MKILSSLVLSVFIATAVLGQQDLSPPTQSPKTEPTTESPEPTKSSSEPTTVSTSSKPTTVSTTHSSSKHTTVSSTSSSSEPTTVITSSSSSEPTKAPKSTTSTSDSPTTVTEEPTPAPEPKPSDVPVVSWNVTEDGETCIRVSMKAYFEITLENSTEYVVVYQNASPLHSKCNFAPDKQSLVLSVPNYYNLSMIFVNESRQVYVNETSIQYNLPGGKGMESSAERLFRVNMGNSYMCNSLDQLKIENVTLVLENVHIQAFGRPGNHDFENAQPCDADDKVNDAIPIAVGCALAALIIIVLIAYLVGRRQSRQRGYQSV